MNDDEFEAELFNPVTTGIFNIDWLHDRETGIWRAPVPTESERERLRHQHLWLANETDPAPFDQVYPMLWRLETQPKSSQSAILVVLDTGCLAEHPLLADCIDETMDFTGEGLDDRVGHGTGCALRARIWPYGGRRPRLFIGKVFGEDRRAVAANLVRGIDWAADYARTSGRALYIMLRLGLYNRRWAGLRACDGSCEVCQAALRAVENPLVWLDAAPGNRPGQTACPAAAALRLQRKPALAAATVAAAAIAGERLLSSAPRDYADAGIATHVVEGDGRYSYAADTVTLYPPALFYRTLSHPALAAGFDARRRAAGEGFIAERGSWRIARLGNRWERVPHWPGGETAEPSDCPFGYGYDQHGLFFSSPALPGFWMRGASTDEIHARLPEAMRAYLAAAPDLPDNVRRAAQELADGLAGRA